MAYYKMNYAAGSESRTDGLFDEERRDFGMAIFRPGNSAFECPYIFGASLSDEAGNFPR